MRCKQGDEFLIIIIKLKDVEILPLFSNIEDKLHTKQGDKVYRDLENQVFFRKDTFYLLIFRATNKSSHSKKKHFLHINHNQNAVQWSS